MLRQCKTAKCCRGTAEEISAAGNALSLSGAFACVVWSGVCPSPAKTPPLFLHRDRNPLRTLALLTVAASYLSVSVWASGCRAGSHLGRTIDFHRANSSPTAPSAPRSTAAPRPSPPPPPRPATDPLSAPAPCRSAAVVRSTGLSHAHLSSRISCGPSSAAAFQDPLRQR